MTDGPRQTKADAASCPLKKRSARIGPVRGVRNSCDHRRARRPPASSNPLPGHHLHSGVDVIRHPNVQRRSRPGTTSRRRATLERTGNRSRRAQWRAEHDRRFGSSRSIPHDDRSPRSGLRPRTGGGTPPCDRTHRSARDWQRYVVGKVLLSPGDRTGIPDAGAGGVAIIKIAELVPGSSLPVRPSERGGRLKSFSVRNHRLQPPALRVGAPRRLGQYQVCTRLCTMLDGSLSKKLGCGNGRRARLR